MKCSSPNFNEHEGEFDVRGAAEATAAADLLRRRIERYQAEAPAAEAETKALTHLCHMLLNTNEFLYVE